MIVRITPDCLQHAWLPKPGGLSSSLSPQTAFFEAHLAKSSACPVTSFVDIPYLAPSTGSSCGFGPIVG